MLYQRLEGMCFTIKGCMNDVSCMIIKLLTCLALRIMLISVFLSQNDDFRMYVSRKASLTCSLKYLFMRFIVKLIPNIFVEILMVSVI